MLLLPQVLYCLTLSWRLAAIAEGGASSAFRVLGALFVLVAVLPVIFLGGGVPALAGPSYALAALSLIALTVCCFLFGSRSWATSPSD